MTLPLPANADALWQALDRKVRNQVRKAEKSDLPRSGRPRAGAGVLRGVRPQHARSRHAGLRERFFATILEEFPATAEIFVVRTGHDADCRLADLPVAQRHRGALGVVAARASRVVPEHAPLLDDAAAGDRGRKHHLRFRPLDAEREHLPLQDPVGRDRRTPFAWEYWLASGRRAARTRARRTRSSRPRSKSGNDCRCT